jgi:hypothetical protein
MKRKWMTRKPWNGWGVSAERLHDFLLIRATSRAAAHGHVISPWSSAKHKLGKGAKRATCIKCGRVVIVMPYGQHGATAPLAKSSPAIAGDAVMQACAGLVH